MVDISRLASRAFRSDGRRAWPIMLLAALAMNGLLVAQNVSLKGQIQRPPHMTVGTLIPELAGVDVSGNTRTVDLVEGRRYLVFTFSVSCQYCNASLDAWKSIAETADSGRTTVVWVSRDSWQRTADFARAHDIRGIVLADVPHRVYSLLGLSAVPQTMLLASNGEVLGRVISGAVTGDRVNQVVALLTLPR
jgi:peroxiredoxin